MNPSVLPTCMNFVSKPQLTLGYLPTPGPMLLVFIHTKDPDEHCMLLYGTKKTVKTMNVF